MITDYLGLLKADGTATGVTATEAGSVLLTKDATTGKRVLDIRKTGQKGLPVVVISGTDAGNSADSTWTVTIEACASYTDWTDKETVATFPAESFGSAGTLMVRRIHTQLRYIRSVITVTGTIGTSSKSFLIFVGHELMNLG